MKNKILSSFDIRGFILNNLFSNFMKLSSSKTFYIEFESDSCNNLLVRYCECFASGIYCDGCNCVNCHNNVEHEAARREAVEVTLERNPNAFRPKIASSPHGARDSRVCIYAQAKMGVFPMMHLTDFQLRILLSPCIFHVRFIPGTKY